MGGFRWDDDVVAKLTEYWKEGFSCSQIAAKLYSEFNFEISRSAVIGKLNRMGMKSNVEVTRIKNRSASRRTLAKVGKKPAPKVNPRPARVMSGLFVGGGGDLPPVEPLPKEESPSDYAKLYTLDQLEKGMCKWPVGDPKTPDFGFCGKDRVPGQPYCMGHCQRAFRAPETVQRASKPERIPTMADLEKV